MSFSEHVDISSDSDVEDYSENKPPSIKVTVDAKGKLPGDALLKRDVPYADALLKRAQMYQDYMNKVPIPNRRGSIIPFNSWTELATSIKKLYGQPLHYQTNILLKEWDRMRVGTEDEEISLDMLIHPSKAEITIWLLEEVHRGTTSPDHLVKLWLIDPWYHTSIDQMYPNLSRMCNS
ncbi:hypothetical protein LIER_08771 [Lithospermum erythrorhizon]|uniref:Uncharacterized protein n=1 Tax=Lithospermum erythrorhizon TaxID=34254 RepID=A0AAV3PDA8_LITER